MNCLKSVITGVLFAGVALASIGVASAQAPSSCPAHEVSLYFEKDKTEFNKFSQALVQRVAQEAKACGARQVIAQTSADKAHADAVLKTFQSVGLAVVVKPVQASATPDDMASRSVLVKLG